MSLTMAPAARKSLERLEKRDRPTAARVKAVLNRIEADPTGPGSKRLTESARDWAARAGKYRVLFRLSDHVVRVEEIESRGRVYRVKN